MTKYDDEETTALTVQVRDEGTYFSEKHMYGTFVGYCFSVNYILGVGVLSIPYAFYSSGVLLGPIILGLVSVVAAFAVNFLVETCARAEFVATHERQQQERDATGEKLATMATGTSTNTTTTEARYEITTRKFEVNKLCHMFLGRGGKIFYEIMVMAYMYGGLWSYVAVFASAIAANIPLPFGADGSWFTCDVYLDGSSSCTWLYLVYVVLFAAIVVPLACIDTTEQKALQVFMTLFRFFALALMIGAALVAFSTDPFSRYHTDPKITRDRYYPPNNFNWDGFHTLLPIAIYSQILHHSIPGISQPVKNKRSLLTIFYGVFATTFISYSLLGVVLAIYYGNHIEPTCSLNFTFYRGGASFSESVPILAKIIGFIVVIFPAVDVISAFPLNAITLGNNIMTAVISDPRKLSSRKWKIPFRLLAAVPPLIGAGIERNLATILKYVGLAGFVIAFVMPAVLQIASRRRCRQLATAESNHHYYDEDTRSGKTPYTLPIVNHSLTAVFVIAVAVLSISFTLVAFFVWP